MKEMKIERCPKCWKVPEHEETHEGAIMYNLFMIDCCGLGDKLWNASLKDAIDAWNDSPVRLRAEIDGLKGQLREADEEAMRMRNGYGAACLTCGKLDECRALSASDVKCKFKETDVITKARARLERYNKELDSGWEIKGEKK